jgi:hypothetical protein
LTPSLASHAFNGAADQQPIRPTVDMLDFCRTDFSKGIVELADRLEFVYLDNIIYCAPLSEDYHDAVIAFYRELFTACNMIQLIGEVVSMFEADIASHIPYKGRI